MKCERVRDDLAVVALGDAQPLAPQLIEHLTQCEACRKAYRDYLSAGEALIASVPEVAPPPGLKARILEQVASSRAGLERDEPGEALDPEPPAPAAPPAVGGGGAAARRRGFGERLPAGIWRWGGAALLVLSAGLGLRTAQLESELLRLREVERVTLGEVTETLRAFSSAPAVFAGRIEFTAVREGIAPEGMLYQRPNGWAVLLQVRGVDAKEAHQYRVWVREGDAWSDAGRLVVAGEEVASLVYYSRSDSLPTGLRIVPNGLRPGEPGWSEEALLVGRLPSDPDPASGLEPGPVVEPGFELEW